MKLAAGMGKTSSVFFIIHIYKKTSPILYRYLISINWLLIWRKSTYAFLTLEIPPVALQLSNALRLSDLTSLEICSIRRKLSCNSGHSCAQPGDARKFLKTVQRSFRSNQSILIVSYPILKGKIYEFNVARAGNSAQKKYSYESFKGGTGFRTLFEYPQFLPPHLKKLNNHQMVINTYY